jgi:hypothetical protein
VEEELLKSAGIANPEYEAMSRFASYTLTKSYPCSSAKEENEREIDEPAAAVITHSHRELGGYIPTPSVRDPEGAVSTAEPQHRSEGVPVGACVGDTDGLRVLKAEGLVGVIVGTVVGGRTGAAVAADGTAVGEAVGRAEEML